MSYQCDTCKVDNCEFAPDGADCINRRSIFADSDFYNYDRYNDNRMEIDEERLKADRQFSEHTINW